MKISVITVCRNAREELEATGRSLAEQEFSDYEWIIVDGASTDGTADFLQTIHDPRARIISEADKGIYDAMNKGLRLAKGERLWFMNAGDLFYDRSSLGKAASAPAEAEVCHGEVMVFDSRDRNLGLRSEVTPHRLRGRLTKASFATGMVVSHQAFIPKRSISPLYQSDRYDFSADLDWMLEILTQPRKTMDIGLVARVRREGATMDNWYRSQWERFRILCRHFGFRRTALNHAIILGRRIRHIRKSGYWR